jgi:hypothetical protein
MIKRFFLRKSMKILDWIMEILFYDKEISEPLKEDPNDLGNIHNPTARARNEKYFTNSMSCNSY